MNTIKIYLAESGRVANLQKDFPLYQGQYQNKLLNVYVPTSLLAPEFDKDHFVGQMSGATAPTTNELTSFVSSQGVYDHTTHTVRTTPSDGDLIQFSLNVSPYTKTVYVYGNNTWTGTNVNEFTPYLANSTNVSVGCLSVQRDGTQYKSVERALRYVKTLTQNNVVYALYERKLPKEITYFSGVGQNAPTLIINVNNISLVNREIIELITSQTCSLEVMPSTILDKDEPIEASELETLQASVNSLGSVVGGHTNQIALLDSRMDTAEDEIEDHEERIETLEDTIATGETFIGTMTTTSSTLPTDQELNTFVYNTTSPHRASKLGDSVIVIQIIAGATDKNFKYIKNATSWTHYEIPAIEKADNGSLGIVKGTYGTGSSNDIQVNITNGEIKEIYADNGTKLSDTIEYANDIKDGTQAVEKANKAQYDFNGVQLLNVNNGASKTYVRDYALPKEFNQAHYLQSDGLTFGLTQPTSGNISVSVPASIGYTTLFDATYTIPSDMKFQIAGKNGYASSFKLSSSAVKGAKFVLTTKISTDSGATFISADVITSDEISFGIGEIKELKFENKFDDLTDVYVLETGDKIEQKLELLSESSVATTITLYTSTYPSRMYLNTMSYAIITSSGLLGEITDLQGVATIGENITIKVDSTTNLNDKCLYELSFSANLTGNLGKNIYLTRDNVESIAINSYLGTGKASDLVMYEIGNTQAYKLLLYYKDNAFYMQNYNIEKLVEGSTYINVELNATDSKLVVELDETNIETETAREDSGKLITSGAVFDDLAEIKSELDSTNLTDTNTTLIRTTGGSLAIKDGQELVKKVEGQSYIWNQLVNTSGLSTTTNNGITYTVNNDGSITCNGTATASSTFNLNAPSLISGNKYLLFGGTNDVKVRQDGIGNDSGSGVIATPTQYLTLNFYIYVANGTTVSNVKVYPQCFNLSLMGLGNITTVAQFKALFPNTYYPYSAPTLVSANNEYKNIGRNLWDEEWEVGYISGATGQNGTSSDNIRSKNYINCFSNTAYYFKGNSNNIRICYYDSNKNFISSIATDFNRDLTTPSNCYYIRFCDFTHSIYNHDICINKSDASFNGTYEPYQSNLLSYNGTLEHKISSVKLKDLNWEKESDYFKSTTTLVDAKRGSTLVPGNILCNLYTPVASDLLSGNNVISVGGSSGRIFIKDSSYTDATALKNHFTDDDVLYYELATPTTEQIVNATNVPLKGIGQDLTIAHDILWNTSGLASWKNGLTEQVNKNGIVAIPYSVSEEFAVSINGQLQANLDVDKSQQEEIQELSDNQNKMDTIFSKQVVGGENVLFSKFNPSNNQDNHWHIVNTKVDDTLTCEDDIVVKGNIEDDHSNSISVANLVSGANVGNAMTNKHLYYHPIKITYTNGSEIIDLRFIIIDNNSNAYNKSTIGYAMAPFGFNINPLFGNYRNGTPFIYEPIANATFSATNFTFYSIKISGTDAGQLRQSIVSFTDSNLVINDSVNQLF